MIIALKVTPGARRNEIVSWVEHYPGIGRMLRIRVAAPPIEGRANKAVVDFLAQALGVPKSTVRIIRGTSGTIKHVLLPDNADITRISVPHSHHTDKSSDR